MNQTNRSIWVFADYRNYFQNRVTLQLLAKANDLAIGIDAEVCAVLFGHETDEYISEYIAHGAQKVLVVEHPSLNQYSVEKFTVLMEKLAGDFQPEIILIGATSFGREFAPRVAKRLDTGLTADCIGLEISAEGHLLQIAPSFGGNLIAEIITPDHRPQMATVRPGTFQELPHDNTRRGEVVRIPLPQKIPADRLRCESFDATARKLVEVEGIGTVVVIKHDVQNLAFNNRHFQVGSEAVECAVSIVIESHLSSFTGIINADVGINCLALDAGVQHDVAVERSGEHVPEFSAGAG